jgi:hypothetical protein
VFSGSISFPPAPDFPLFVYIPDLLLVVEMVLLFSTGLFMIGVQGIRLLRNGQGWLVFFVITLVLLLPLSQLAYSLWGMHGTSPGETVILAPGYFLVGNVAFPSIASLLWFVALAMAPYLALGGLLLALAHNPLSTRSVQVIHRFGILIVLLLALNLAIIGIWDINRWLGGHAWIFDPSAGIWPFFRGQWGSALATNALVLALTLSIALIALIRSFTIRPDGENNVEQQAA